LKKALQYSGLALMFAVMLAAVLMYLAPHLGWRIDAVGSGSMEPYLRTGSLVVTRPVEPEEIEIGDIITFEPSSSKTMVIHRVIGVEAGSLLNFITKGDSNLAPDSYTVPAAKITGIICFRLPYMGYFAAFMNTIWGYLLGIVIPAATLIYIFCRGILQSVISKKDVPGEQ
jgi:signal peptidase